MTLLEIKQSQYIYCPMSQVKKAVRQAYSGNRIKLEKYFTSKNNAENKAGRLASELFLFFKKTLYELKPSGQHLSPNIF